MPQNKKKKKRFNQRASNNYRDRMQYSYETKIARIFCERHLAIHQVLGRRLNLWGRANRAILVGREYRGLRGRLDYPSDLKFRTVYQHVTAHEITRLVAYTRTSIETWSRTEINEVIYDEYQKRRQAFCHLAAFGLNALFIN